MCIIASCIIPYLHAQSDEGTTIGTSQKHSILVSGGVTIPQGNLAGKDTASAVSEGVAMTGYVFQLRYEYQTKKHIGLSASLHYEETPVDEVFLTEYVQNYTKRPATIRSGPWSNIGLTIGVYGVINVAPKLSFKPMVNVGAGYFSSPEVNSSSNTMGNLFETFSSISVISMQYSFGAAAEYRVVDGVIARLSGEYSLANPVYQKIIYAFPVLQEIRFQQQTNTVRVMLGIGVNL